MLMLEQSGKAEAAEVPGTEKRCGKPWMKFTNPKGSFLSGISLLLYLKHVAALRLVTGSFPLRNWKQNFKLKEGKLLVLIDPQY